MKKTISDAGAARLQTILAKVATAKTPAERALLSQQMKELVANDPGKGSQSIPATPAPRGEQAKTGIPTQTQKPFVAGLPGTELQGAIASWSDRQGQRSADALIEAGLILRTEGSRAAEIIAKEICACLAGQDYPPVNGSDQDVPPDLPA